MVFVLFPVNLMEQLLICYYAENSTSVNVHKPINQSKTPIEGQGWMVVCNHTVTYLLAKNMASQLYILHQCKYKHLHKSHTIQV